MLRADQLVNDLFSDPHGFREKGDGNELLNQFLRGYPLDKLRLLLHHQHEEVVATGIWIASELGHEAAAFVNDAVAALQHPNNRIRYFALDVIALGTRGQKDAEFFQIVKRLEDSDVAVRQRALELLSSATDQQLISATSRFALEEHYSPHATLLRLLLRKQSSDVAEVEEMIRSGDGLRIKYGIAIAERLYRSYPQLLELAASLEEEEYRSVAEHMLSLHKI